MSETVRILTEARELLSDEAHWTKGQEARTESMNATDAMMLDATCWCVEGAMRKAARGIYSYFADALHFFRKAIDRDAAHTWQDAPERTHAEVLAALDKAIALAQAEVAA